MNTDQPTSLTLLERVRGRDPAAWGRLVYLYRPLVLDWCGKERDQALVRRHRVLLVSKTAFLPIVAHENRPTSTMPFVTSSPPKSQRIGVRVPTGRLAIL